MFTHSYAKDARVKGYKEHGKGIVKGNPRRCLRCGQPIRAREKWVKMTSGRDYKLGSYSLIVHDKCIGRG
jgi:hypothetical protein